MTRAVLTSLQLTRKACYWQMITEESNIVNVNTVYSMLLVFVLIFGGGGGDVKS